jgi:hypothetical protein
MTPLSQQRMDELARDLDAFATLDLTGLGVIAPMYQALIKKQAAPMCLGAANFINRALSGPEPLVLILTGFPMGGGVPETDGPVGAALLARAFIKAFDARVVLVTDYDWVGALEGACIGAGITPVHTNGGVPQKVPYLRQAYVQAVDKGDQACRAVCDGMLRDWQPKLVAAVERPGKNHKGTYHGMNGRPLTGKVADLDYLFECSRKLGVPTLAVGDGGNELGMGLIKDELPAFIPQTSPGLPYGGTAAQQAADYLVVSGVSNWGASCVVAGLGLLLGRLDVLHRPRRESRSLELCAGRGAVDGGTLAPDPLADGVPAAEYEGLWRGLRGMMRRGLGLNVDWRREQECPS